MKKILLSVFTILGVFAIAAAGTRAVFTDSTSSEGNILGVESKFEVVLDGKNAFGNRVSERFFNVSDLVPTDINRDNLNKIPDWEKPVKTAYLEIKNDSNMPMLFRAYADKVTSDPYNLRNLIKVRVTLNPSEYDENYLDGGRPYGSHKDVILGTWTIDQLRNKDLLNNVSASFTEGWPLPPNYVATYKLEVFLDITAGNEYQGKTLNADLVVDATQYDGQKSWDIIW